MVPAGVFPFILSRSSATIPSHEDESYPVVVKGTVMKKAKLIAIIVVLILSIVIILQNAEMVQVHVLFWTGQMSQALLMLLIFGLGLLAGILVATNFLRKKGAKG